MLISVCFPLLTEPTEPEKMETDSDSQQPDKVRFNPATSIQMCLLLCHVYWLIEIRSEVIYHFPAQLGFLAMHPSSSLSPY